ncbi:MAG: purine-binding chemotaxis protein CheW, partial [Geminicoccaceae bacterium]|nr:purine-binding chemotaxis protein CheW [Geminicoccaceae bacterium]
MEAHAENYQPNGIDALDLDHGHYLTFMLDGEEYGVDILRVQEIRGWTKTTALPNTPGYVKGIINLRGAIVPILDLRERFGLSTAEYGRTTVVVVLKVARADHEIVMGIVVDAVSDVHNLASEEIKDTPDFGSSVDIRYARGLATVG